MKYISGLSAKIVAAIVIGLLLASVGTKITYDCTPIDGSSACVSFDKAVMHPGDLLDNKQDSLAHFITAFCIAFVISLAVLIIVSVVRKRLKPKNK